MCELLPCRVTSIARSQSDDWDRFLGVQMHGMISPSLTPLIVSHSPGVSTVRMDGYLWTAFMWIRGSIPWELRYVLSQLQFSQIMCLFPCIHSLPRLLQGDNVARYWNLFCYTIPAGFIYQIYGLFLMHNAKGALCSCGASCY